MCYFTIFIYPFYTIPIERQIACFRDDKEMETHINKYYAIYIIMGWVSITLIANDTTTWGYPRINQPKMSLISSRGVYLKSV